jgi:hypothetical protein
VNGPIPFELPERTPEQIAGRSIVVAMGGQVRHLPVLAIRPNRDWQATFSAAIEKVLVDLPSVDSLNDLSALATVGMERMVDLLVSYDATSALGGKEWIENNAAPAEVYEALKQVTAAAFPFGVDLARFAPELRMALLQTMAARISSTPTKPSPTRTARRTKSRKG